MLSTECVASWTRSFGIDDTGGDGGLGIRSARFSARSLFPSTSRIDPEGHFGALAFDGRSFVVGYGIPTGLRVARLDPEAPTADKCSALAPVAIAPVAPGQSLLFALVDDVAGGGFALSVTKIESGTEDLVPPGDSATTASDDSGAPSPRRVEAGRRRPPRSSGSRPWRSRPPPPLISCRPRRRGGRRRRRSSVGRP